jgi:hypothetical protein
MTLQTAMLATLIVVLGAAQYALCAQAIQDLRRRPRVRGENKVLWGLGILCVPIAGAIVYNWMGPTSFIHRTPTARDARGADPDRDRLGPHDAAGSTNITPISAARSVRRRRVAETTHPERAIPRKHSASNVRKVDRTGS